MSSTPSTRRRGRLYPDDPAHGDFFSPWVATTSTSINTTGVKGGHATDPSLRWRPRGGFLNIPIWIGYRTGREVAGTAGGLQPGDFAPIGVTWVRGLVAVELRASITAAPFKRLRPADSECGPDPGAGSRGRPPG